MYNYILILNIMKIHRNKKIEPFVINSYYHIITIYMHILFSLLSFYLRLFMGKYTLFTPLIRRVIVISI